MSLIHSTAIIDSTAKIDPSVKIGPWCVVGSNVTLGKDVILKSHVIIDKNTTIGNGSVIYSYAVIGGDPQDKKYVGEETWLRIGSNNIIREHVTMHRGTSNDSGDTTVGNDNLFMVGVHIAHDCHIGNEVVIANNALLAGHVTLHDKVGIGGGAGLHHFLTVGRLAYVGGFSRCTQDIPPFVLVEGNPAGIRSLNNVGLKRSGLSETEIEELRSAYKKLYRENDKTIRLTAQELLEQDLNKYSKELCLSVIAKEEGCFGRSREKKRTDSKWKSAEATS